MLRIYSAIHLQHWSPAERESKAHQAEPSVWKTWEGISKWRHLFQANVWGRVNAKLCVDDCNALRGRLQSFALADAMLCVGWCKALRLRWARLAQKSSVLFWIREKGGQTHHTGHCCPPKVISVGPVSAQNKTSLHAGRTKKRCLAVTRHLWWRD